MHHVLLTTLKKNYLRDELKPVILQSDGCGYQNRNPVWFYDDLILSMGNKEYQYNKSLVREHRHIEFNSIYSTMDTILEKKRH